MGLCKLYNGGEINPYKPFPTSTDSWAIEYLKFHVWDAEFAFVANYWEWLDMWQRKENKRDANDPKSVYRFVIGCKLMKMHRDDINFEKLYKDIWGNGTRNTILYNELD